MLWLGGLTVVYALASLAWAPIVNPYSLVNWLSLLIAFWAGSATNLRPNIWLIAFVTLALPIYMLWPVLNPNIVGCVIAIALAASIECEAILFWPIGIVGLLFTESRTAIIAGTCAFVFKFWRKPVTMLGLVAAAAIFIAFRRPDVHDIWQRMGIWQSTINHLTLWGHGLGSYQSAYDAFPIKINTTALSVQHPYNDWLELIFELGLGALPLIVMLAVVLLEGRGKKVIPLTFLVLSLAYFPLSIPLVAQAFAFAIGQLYRRLPYGTLETCRSPLPQG